MDETVKIIIKIVGLVLMLIGTVFIFDARKIGKKWFSFGDRNEAAKTLKIIGSITCIIGGLIAALI